MRAWPALEVGPVLAAAVDFDLIEAALLDYDLAAIEETSSDSRRVFFHRARDRDRAAVAIGQQFSNIAITCVDVPDEDWAARSQANLRAVQVGNIIVAPPWDVPDVRRPGPDFRTRHPITIVIQPSMGFGTGHHATTRLCLDALQHVDVHGRRVIDVGTGSGVLAIAAARLGAAKVLGIDDDADAIQSATENVGLNGGGEVGLRVANFRSETLGPFDLVIANLTGGLLISSAAALRALAASDALLILSGFLLSEEDAVTVAIGGRVKRRSCEDEWLCVTVSP